VIQLLLALSLLIQGIPVRPSEGGTITGTVRMTDGKPAVGIRVAARARTDTLEDTIEGAALAALAETDASGRYRLEGVPPGRYTISAGRVDLPTYYPGTLDLASGTVLAIASGSTISGIDFTLADISFVVAGLPSQSGIQQSVVMMPLKVTVEGGGKVPVFAAGKFVRLVFDPSVGTPTSHSFDAQSVELPFPVIPTEYRVVIESLPAGYALKSMTYGSTDLRTRTLRLSAADLPLPGAVSPASPISARTPAELAITLASGSPPLSGSGVRVAGRARNAGVRSIYISDIPGTVYSDGTFEFRGVPPGQHIVMAGDPRASSPMVASVIMGDRDLEGVELEPVDVLPREFPAVALSENHPPGTVIPLAGLRGRVLSETTQQPIRGVLTVMGMYAKIAYPIDTDGRFEVPKLLPGSYFLQVSVFDYFTVNETVVVGEKDVSVDLRAKRAY
jgi:Carboxypeptidase regulatory-like domain